jgi:anti-sigma B factor antagonist
VTAPLADIHVEPRGQVVVAHVQGELDMSNADQVGAALVREVPTDVRAVVLDLREVGYLDSAGIQLIYNLRKRLDHRGQQLRLVVVPGSAIDEALRITGVPAAIGARESVQSAIDSLDG